MSIRRQINIEWFSRNEMGGGQIISGALHQILPQCHLLRTVTNCIHRTE